MLETLESFGRALGATPLSKGVHDFLVNTYWAAPTVQILHILSVAVVIGSAGAICLRLMNVTAQSQSVLIMAKRFIPFIWGALTVTLLTGSVLIINRPTRYFDNWIFLSKVTLIVIGVSALLGFQSSLRRRPQFWETAPGVSAPARAFGAGFILLWLAVIFAGRWIAYA